ncbi:MAG TPA: hypothetical protein VF831_11240 [Anaerolineales bacterium]
MDAANKQLLPERNSKTYAEHRREVFWQITIPLVVGGLLILAAIVAIVFFATQPAPQLDRWADVSLMWLIFPSLFIVLIMLVVLIGIVFAVTVIFRKIPRYAHLLQLYAEIAETKVRHFTNLATEPILRTHGLLAVLRRLPRWGHKSEDQHR